MSNCNPDISVNIHNAILLILRGEQSVTQAVADIMRIPLEQVVDGSVYQFELEVDSDDTNSHVFSACMHEGDGKTTKRISHYDLRDADIAMAYCEQLENFRLDHWQDEQVGDNKGTLRAIKTREAV